MPTTPAGVATRITTAELTWLLSLRPGPSATLVATALGIPVEALSAPPKPAELKELVTAGRAHQRRGELLPRGESAVVGDVLTSASTLISVGSSDGIAALAAVGRDRVLIAAPAAGGIEVAALDATTTPGTAVAALAGSVAAGAEVMVAVPGAEITAVEPGADLAERIDGMLP
ncbi:hypothetical protein [Pseudactinotalea sp.]|uniref:hypothetical protein n=1 Tax=Pseudactinotalea sp. TaxID=1926260 RepID=UPI003B3AB835